MSNTCAPSSSAAGGYNLQRRAQSAAPQRLKQSVESGALLKAIASAARITCGRLVSGVLALTMLVAVAGSERGRRLQTHGVALGVQMANNTGARGFSGYGMPATGNQTPHESNITHDKRKAVGSKLTL